MTGGKIATAVGSTVAALQILAVAAGESVSTEAFVISQVSMLAVCATVWLDGQVQS